MGDVLSGEITQPTVGRTVFASGCSKNAPTKTQDLLRCKQIINPDRSVGVNYAVFYTETFLPSSFKIEKPIPIGILGLP